MYLHFQLIISITIDCEFLSSPCSFFLKKQFKHLLFISYSLYIELYTVILNTHESLGELGNVVETVP